MTTISDLQADILSIVQITSVIEAYLHTKQYNQRTAALEAYWWAATYQLALEHNLDNLLPAFAALQQNMSNLEHNSLNRIRNSDNHTLQPIDLLLLHLKLRQQTENRLQTTILFHYALSSDSEVSRLLASHSNVSDYVQTHPVGFREGMKTAPVVRQLPLHCLPPTTITIHHQDFQIAIPSNHPFLHNTTPEVKLAFGLHSHPELPEPITPSDTTYSINRTCNLLFLICVEAAGNCLLQAYSIGLRGGSSLLDTDIAYACVLRTQVVQHITSH